MKQNASLAKGQRRWAIVGGIIIVGGFSLLAKIPDKPATPANRVATTPARPSYCQNKAATYRLPECGVSESERRELDAAPERERANAEAFYQYWSAKAHTMCDKPIAQMTMEDVEDCKRPGMRLLRGD